MVRSMRWRTLPTSANCAASSGATTFPNSTFTCFDFCRSRSTSQPRLTSVRVALPSIRRGEIYRCLDPRNARTVLNAARPREWEMPAPIHCHLLGAASYRITADLIDELVNLGLSQAAASELSRYIGILFRGEARLRRTIESLGQSAAILALIDPLLAGSITDDSPKAHLIPTEIQPDPSAVAVAVGPQIGSPTIEHQRIAAGNLSDWGVSLGMLPANKVVVIDPERGRFWFRTPPPPDNVWVPLYHYGFSGDIGAGTYDRRDSIETANRTLIPNGGDGQPGPVPMVVPTATAFRSIPVR